MTFTHKTFKIVRKAHPDRNFDSVFVFTILYDMTGTPVLATNNGSPYIPVKE